jgi:hypothetical protein
MSTTHKTWPFTLLLLAGVSVSAEPVSNTPRARAATLERVERLAAQERAERASTQLQCRLQREQLTDAIQAKQAECASETQRFDECRAQRPGLQGAELLGCGIGIAVGLAAGGIAHPWSLGECGVAEQPASQVSCSVPDCEPDPEVIEAEVLAEQGLSEVPRCDEPVV